MGFEGFGAELARSFLDAALVRGPRQAAQINGDREVDEEFVGPYLEVRALLHAYRAARIEPGPAPENEMFWQRMAQSLADAALDHDVDETVEDLPLWSGLMEERSTA